MPPPATRAEIPIQITEFGLLKTISGTGFEFKYKQFLVDIAAVCRSETHPHIEQAAAATASLKVVK
jgi:hypothetical protein